MVLYIFILFWLIAGILFSIALDDFRVEVILLGCLNWIFLFMGGISLEYEN
jgi:hypothetical protein